MDSPPEEFENYIDRIDDETINSIANYDGNLPISSLESLVTELMEIIERFHGTLSDETYQEELNNNLISRLFGLNPKNISFFQVYSILKLSKGGITKEGISLFQSKISRMPIVKEENPHISVQQKHFLNHRSKLIAKLSSYGNEINRNYLISKFHRLFGFATWIIHWINLDSYLDVIPIQSFKPLYFLGRLARFLLVSATYFAPLCIITTCAEFYRAKSILNNCIKLIEEYKRNLSSIREFDEETNAMQAIVTDIFLQKIDKQIIKNVEEALTHLTSAQKIFAAVLVSGMKKYPLCIKDGMFLHMAYQFSITEEAKEWFRRLLNHIDFDVAREGLDDELTHLKMMQCISIPNIQVFLSFFKAPVLPGIVLNGLHALSLGYEIMEFKNPNPCILSKDIKNCALKLQNSSQRVQDSQAVIES